MSQSGCCDDPYCVDDKYCKNVDVVVIYDADEQLHYVEKKTGEIITDVTGLRVGNRPLGCLGWFAHIILERNNLPTFQFNS